MSVALGSRVEITLDVYERVAWRGEPVRIEAAALERADDARASFLRLLTRPEVTVYGVTSGYGDRAGSRLDADERRRQAISVGFRAASFGSPLPERVARGIVLARLANFLDGHAAVSGRLVEAVAALLDNGRLPPVPLQGNGGSGEILALSHLFAPLIEASDLGEKEGLALINGSPCAAALVADAALAAERRLRLAYDVFATSVEAFQAPLDAYDEELEALWGDEHEARRCSGSGHGWTTTAERRSAPGTGRVPHSAAGAGPGRACNRRGGRRCLRLASLRVRQPRLPAAVERLPGRQGPEHRRLPQRRRAGGASSTGRLLGRPLPARGTPCRTARLRPDGRRSRTATKCPAC